MGYKVEVLVGGTWSTNAVCFNTESEAKEAGNELLSRWMAPTDFRVAQSSDQVNYRFDFQAWKPVRLNIN